MKKIINKLFATPLKASISTACIILVVIAAGTVAVSAARSSRVSSDTAASSADIEIAEATEAAIVNSTAAEDSSSTDASVSDSSATDNAATGSTSADIEIAEATDAAIVNSDASASTSGNNENASSDASASDTAASTGTVDLETAKQIALADAGVTASEATFTKAKTDYDDGVSIYEIEFYTQTTEYEYDILVSDGSILKESAKAFSGTDSTSGSSSSDSYISVEEAKTIALNRAGLSTSDVTFKKAALDKDDGVMVYEIEFYQGRTEYECTINAVTGTIVEYDMDTDD